jgi:hypothetical protein
VLSVTGSDADAKRIVDPLALSCAIADALRDAKINPQTTNAIDDQRKERMGASLPTRNEGTSCDEPVRLT